VNNELAARGITRLCLHARSLRFRHPESGEQLDLQAPLDEAFEQALLTLREKGGQR
jgi:23S rRNA pseudouridine955/2504/2580 synthase